MKRENSILGIGVTALDMGSKKLVFQNRDAVVNLTYGLIGTPYGWGGNGPDNFDCYGFAKYTLIPIIT